MHRPTPTTNGPLMRVGALAKAVGKTVRAMHLYEELGLLDPETRSEGGFRLYGQGAIERIAWIGKMQAIGFSLAEIQAFVRDFRAAHSSRQATDRVRAVFAERRAAIHAQIAELQGIERDLEDSLDYLASCSSCTSGHASPSRCGTCAEPGHEAAPPLFAGLSRTTHKKRALRVIKGGAPA